MQGLALLIVIFVPSFLWVWFFYRQDSAEREPPVLLLRTFLFGIASVAVAGGVELVLLRSLSHAVAPADPRFVQVVLVGFVEETAKLGAFYAAVHRVPDLDEPVDAVVYAVTAALGFAAAENLIYVLSFGLSVAPVRAVLTSLAHASFTGLAGYYVGLVRFRMQPRYVGWFGLLVASLAHGTYNFFITDDSLPAWLVIPFTYVLYRLVLVKMQMARRLRDGT